MFRTNFKCPNCRTKFGKNVFITDQGSRILDPGSEQIRIWIRIRRIRGSSMFIALYQALIAARLQILTYIMLCYCAHKRHHKRINKKEEEILSKDLLLAWGIVRQGKLYLSVWRTRYDRVEQSRVIVSCVPGNGNSLRRRPPMLWRSRRIQCSVTLMRERHTSTRNQAANDSEMLWS